MTARDLAALERKCRAADELRETIHAFWAFLFWLNSAHVPLACCRDYHRHAVRPYPEPEPDK